MTNAQNTRPGTFDDQDRREARRTQLRAYPGWTITTYVDQYGRETFSAADSRSHALSPLEGSFADALYFVKHGEPCLRDPEAAA